MAHNRKAQRKAVRHETAIINGRQCSVERQVLTGADAEFLLKKCKQGKFAIRVGRIWRVPPARGCSTLLLDYDSCKSFDRARLRERLNICGVKAISIRQKASPSGTGIHVAIKVQGALDKYAIIALQCLLESDPIREAQNFRRALCMSTKQWFETGNVLFTRQ